MSEKKGGGELVRAPFFCSCRASRDWPQLVELADKRMYEAKSSGKDRAILPDEETVA